MRDSRVLSTKYLVRIFGGNPWLEKDTERRPTGRQVTSPFDPNPQKSEGQSSEAVQQRLGHGVLVLFPNLLNANGLIHFAAYGRLGRKQEARGVHHPLGHRFSCEPFNGSPTIVQGLRIESHMGMGQT